MNLIRNCTLTALVIVACSASCFAAGYYQVYDLATAQAGTTATFLDSVMIDGTTTYNLLRTNENVVTKITDAGTLNTASVLTSNATWSAFSSAAIAGQLGGDVAGNVIRFANFFSNDIQQVDLGTGTPSSYVSNAQLLSSLGLTSSQFSIVATNAVSAAGEVGFYNADSDARMIAVTTGPGSATMLLNQAGITALTGGNTLNGGMSFVGTDLYFASNSSDSIYKVNSGGIGTQVLSQAAILAVTGQTAAGFDDLFTGGDGRVYFFETESDSILSFLPANPASSLKEVLSATDLASGPMNGINVDMLAWFNGNIAWAAAATTGGQVPGFYSIPEPMSMVFVCIGGLIALQLRRV